MAKLAAETWIEVIGGAGSMAEATALIPRLRPDIAIVDVNLGDGNGISLCRSLRRLSPTTRCILHTSVEIGPETAAAAGAAAMVLKQLVGSRLIDTIRAVAESDGPRSDGVGTESTDEDL